MKLFENSSAVGFTGTREGCTNEQRLALREVLLSLYTRGGRWLHHGDCLGADETAHRVARELGFSVTIHPPTSDRFRAFCKSAQIVLAPKLYLIRDSNIVKLTKVLIACPKSTTEEMRSGTWATVRKARKANKPVILLWPDGTETKERMP